MDYSQNSEKAKKLRELRLELASLEAVLRTFLVEIKPSSLSIIQMERITNLIRTSKAGILYAQQQSTSS